MPDKIYIYGDSLLKATVPDENMHYRFHLPEVMAQYRAATSDDTPTVFVSTASPY